MTQGHDTVMETNIEWTNYKDCLSRRGRDKAVEAIKERKKWGDDKHEVRHFPLIV
jgi:hypothetical protein